MKILVMLKERWKKLFGVIVLLTGLYSLSNPVFSQTPSADGTTRIVLKAIEGMQYDRVQIWVKPGTDVKLILENDSKEEHNLIITKPGTRQKIVGAALRLGVKGMQMNFVPKSDDVLWTIPVLKESQSDSIRFTSPEEEGAYPYVCTFPGHGNVMYGVLYVGVVNHMPPLKEDENIPSSRRK